MKKGHSEYKHNHGIQIDFGIRKKSLKIPKEKSESVNRSTTDTTMAKRKCTKGQSTIYKTDSHLMMMMFL